jgi:hypothetical protein
VSNSFGQAYAHAAAAAPALHTLLHSVKPASAQMSIQALYKVTGTSCHAATLHGAAGAGAGAGAGATAAVPVSAC